MSIGKGFERAGIALRLGVEGQAALLEINALLDVEEAAENLLHERWGVSNTGDLIELHDAVARLKRIREITLQNKGDSIEVVKTLRTVATGGRSPQIDQGEPN